jgi:hypothetical protein
MSTLVAQTISNGTVSTSSANVIQGSAKAWVNFNGQGTVAIRASYNVSSITDNGVGNYTVNLTNAMVDADYAIASINCPIDPGGGIIAVSPSNSFPQTTTTFRLIYQNYVGSTFDIANCYAVIFR